ncbi:MAG: hypothetical protein GY845_29240 [Planctomycetes bacterium]|nr:hypothetical protein [Planctomycetota bacterium]
MMRKLTKTKRADKSLAAIDDEIAERKQSLIGLEGQLFFEQMTLANLVAAKNRILRRTLKVSSRSVGVGEVS